MLWADDSSSDVQQLDISTVTPATFNSQYLLDNSDFISNQVLNIVGESTVSWESSEVDQINYLSSILIEMYVDYIYRNGYLSTYSQSRYSNIINSLNSMLGDSVLCADDLLKIETFDKMNDYFLSSDAWSTMSSCLSDDYFFFYPTQRST